MNVTYLGVAGALGFMSMLASAAQENTESEPQQQTADNRIVVTSQWRKQNEEDVSVSLSVLTATEIAEREAFHLDQMLNAIANLNFNTGANRGRYIQIRGIGERSQFDDPINPSVGFFVDGIDLSGTLGGATLFDVAQVEVLRGPQSVRFGASALAGAVYLSTEAADSTRDRLTFSAAEAETFATGFAKGLFDDGDQAMRLAVHQLSSDGFYNNIYLNRGDTNNRDEFTARLKYQVEISPDWDAQINWHHFDIDNGYDAFSLDNNRNTRSDQPGFDREETNAVSVISEFIGYSVGKLDTLFSFNDSDIDYGYDEDWTFTGFHPDEYSSFDRYLRDRQTLNFDIKLSSLTSRALLGGSTDWLVGLYARDESEDLTRQYTFLGSDFNYQYDTQTVAIYGEVSTQYGANWRSSVGLRIEDRSTNYLDSFIARRETSDQMTGGHWTLGYQLDRSSKVYFLISRGFKAGGINPNSELSDNLRSFGIERADNLEFGYKTRFSDGYLNLAAFYMERRDQQVNQYTTITRPDSSTAFVPFINNADNGRNSGLEIEGAWSFSPAFRVDYAFGYLKTEIDSIFLADGGVIKDREAAQAPSYNYHLGFSYAFDNSWSTQFSFEGKDRYFFSESHQEQSIPVDLLNWRLEYRANSWQASLWARNASDKLYYTRGFGGFGNDPRDGYQTKPYYQLGDPRQVGVTLELIY